MTGNNNANPVATASSLRPRILYGSLFAWMSITGGRFLAPFLEHEALCADSMIGIILAFQYGIMGVLSPLLGSLADAQEREHPNFGRAKVLTRGALIGSLCFILHGASRVWPSFPFLKTWGYHLVVHCGHASCFATMFPVLDGMTVDYLKRYSGDSKDYGKERMYGAVSWGIANLMLGPLIDMFGFVVYYPCTVVVALYAVITIILFSRSQTHAQAQSSSQQADPLSALEGNTNSEEDPNSKAQSTETDASPDCSTLSLVLLVFGTAYGAAFGFCYFILNTGFSVVENMVFLFLEFLGGSNTVCGITVAVTVVFEIPMFHIAPAMLRKYGVGWLLLLACAAFWIRVMGYTMIPEGQPWWILLLEWLHGFTYAGAQSSAVEFVTQQMPPGLEASGQGIVNFVRGMASIIGLYAGGALQDAFGPRVMYRVFVAAVTVGMTLLAVVRCKYPSEQEQARYDPIPDVSESSRHWDVVHRRNSSRSSSIRDLN